MIHVLVADSRTLRVFEVQSDSRDRPGNLTEIVDFRNAAAGHHERDLVSDRAGRVMHGTARMRQSYEPRVQPKRHSMQLWLGATLRALPEVLEPRNSDGLVLVASPRLLAELRKQMPARLRKRVVGELPRDLARQSPATLKLRLQPSLRAAARNTPRGVSAAG